MSLDKTLSCEPAKLMVPEHIHSSWCVIVGPEIKLSDVLSPRYWRYVKNLKVNDIIEVISESFDAFLRVVVAGDSLVVVRTILATEVHAPADAKIGTGKAGKLADYVPGKKWRALGTDGNVISSGHATREAAEAVARAA